MNEEQTPEDDHSALLRRIAEATEAPKKRGGFWRVFATVVIVVLLAANAVASVTIVNHAETIANHSETIVNHAETIALNTEKQEIICDFLDVGKYEEMVYDDDRVENINHQAHAQREFMAMLAIHC